VELPSRINAGPSLCDGVLCVSTSIGTHHGIDAETGIERWSFTEKLVSSVPAASRDGFLYLATDASNVIACIPASGQLAWRSEIPELPLGACAATDDLLLVPTMPRASTHCLFALDRASGELAWSYNPGFPVKLAYVSATSHRIYVALSRERELHVLDHGGALRWRLKTASSIACAPLLHDGVMLITTKRSVIAF
jgi:outer membrane protein assembly factor BamB